MLQFTQDNPENLHRWSYRRKPQSRRLPQNATRSVAVTQGLLADIVNCEYTTQILISTAVFTASQLSPALNVFWMFPLTV